MTNLEHLDEMLVEHYVEEINKFIGGEPAIKIDKCKYSQDTIEFLSRLVLAINKMKNEHCSRQCLFKK